MEGLAGKTRRAAAVAPRAVLRAELRAPGEWPGPADLRAPGEPRGPVEPVDLRDPEARAESAVQAEAVAGAWADPVDLAECRARPLRIVPPRAMRASKRRA